MCVCVCVFWGTEPVKPLPPTAHHTHYNTRHHSHLPHPRHPSPTHCFSPSSGGRTCGSGRRRRPAAPVSRPQTPPRPSARRLPPSDSTPFRRKPAVETPQPERKGKRGSEKQTKKERKAANVHGRWPVWDDKWSVLVNVFDWRAPDPPSQAEGRTHLHRGCAAMEEITQVLSWSVIKAYFDEKGLVRVCGSRRRGTALFLCVCVSLSFSGCLGLCLPSFPCCCLCVSMCLCFQCAVTACALCVRICAGL